MSNSCLQLKGSVVTTFILEIYRYSKDEFAQQLKDKVSQAPAFFDQSPVVISLEKLSDNISHIDLSELIDICRQNNLQPMAFRSLDDAFTSEILKTGLTHLSSNVSRTKSPISEKQIDTKSETEVKPVVKAESRKSKIISRPVRSGQQVYAEGADLIILSQVSEGAEVLADGHIHVYGTLRGRALAGVKGDESARVFCKSIEAELVSIAGNFMLSDALREKVWKQSAQVYLDDNALHVEAL